MFPRIILLSCCLLLCSCSTASKAVEAITANVKGAFEGRQPPAPPRPARSFSDLELSSPHTAPVVSLAPLDGESFLSLDETGKILAWRKGDAHPRLFYDVHDKDPSRRATMMHLSPRGKFLALVRRGVVIIIEVRTGAVAYSLTRLRSDVISLDFAPDESSLILGAADARVYRWKFVEEAETGSLNIRQRAFERYNGPTSVVGSVVYHSSGRVFFSADWSGGLDAWLAYDKDPFGGEYDQNLFGPRFFADLTQRKRGLRSASAPAIDHLRLSSDGKTLVGAARDGSLELWQVRGFSKGGGLSAHAGLIYDLALDSSTSTIATVGRDGRLVFWRFRKLGEEELRAALDPSILYVVEKIREVDLPDVRTIRFLDHDTLIAGERQGRIIAVSVTP